MKLFASLIVVIALILIPIIGVKGVGLNYLFGVVIPYISMLVFLIGAIYRVVNWAKSPVPFRITTTCGQQKSLPWIKWNPLENPVTNFQATIRMVLEVLLFRSLFRNTRMELREGPKLAYASSKWLWMGALAFHISFFTVLFRHLRFFTYKEPSCIRLIEKLDSFFQVGLPVLYISGIVLVGALIYLFLRRITIPQLRYISLISDYFPLFLIMGIGITGILMRYFLRVDVIAIKELALGLVTLHPSVPKGIGVIFYIHLFLVSTLMAYFPFSKLMHMGGVFLSPTRNLPNNSRIVRHINPWNYPVKVHTYEEYEEEFREKMIEAGIPVEKE